MYVFQNYFMQVFFQFVGIICKLKPCLETLQLICEENL